MIFHLGVLASQRPITLGYPAPAFGERRYKRSFGLFVCTNRTCGVVRVIDHGLPLWQLLRAGSYDASLLCAAFRRAAMVSHSAARSNKTRRPVSSDSARASHRQRAAWCNRSDSFTSLVPAFCETYFGSEWLLKECNDFLQIKIRWWRGSNRWTYRYVPYMFSAWLPRTDLRHVCVWQASTAPAGRSVTFCEGCGALAAVAGQAPRGW